MNIGVVFFGGVVFGWATVVAVNWRLTVLGRNIAGLYLRRKIGGGFTPYESLVTESVVLAGAPVNSFTARHIFRQLVREGYYEAYQKPVFTDGTVAYMRTDKQLP